ncbi:MAG: SufS family cysteine desulfurase [Candidatus Thermoplasmatota archaeon]|nr:SufS family cysteine desulfurase [Candidatus Thermoplasmatota archaeon]MCL5790305.1 SufS family cysteine desulfurase [Candidatus Thermoplasmatota archaeon]
MINTYGNKDDFPIFNKRVNGKRIIYLDSTATTQKPRQVLDAIIGYYEGSNANVHRSVYKLADEATEVYERSRKNIGDFIGSRENEIVFTRNTTESLNLLSYTVGESLKKGDRILITSMEHHSNILPWMRLEERGVILDYVGLDEMGHLDLEDLKSKLKRETRIVSVAHQSNVLGTINPIEEIGKIAKDNGSIFIVDAAQSVPHMPFRIREEYDFVAFSGHKMLGPMGIGVLYGKYNLLEEMPPFNRGGEMIKDVDFHNAIFEDPPIKFEAGTPNVEGAVGLSAAVDYLKNIGMEEVRRHERYLTSITLKSLDGMKNVKYYGPRDPDERGGVIAFNVKDTTNLKKDLEGRNIKVDRLYHSHDIATFLDDRNVYVRSGHHCAEPLMRTLNITGTARASFYVYNGDDDVEAFISSLSEI